MNEWLEYQLGDAPKTKKPEGVPKAGNPKGKENLRGVAQRDPALDTQERIGKWAGKILNEVND